MSEKIKIDGCTLGEYIKSIRNVRNLSTQKLAEMAGLSAGYVNKIELDRTTNYDINRLKQLAMALKIDMNKILQYIGYKETKQEVSDDNILISYLKNKNLTDEAIKEILNYIEYLQYKQSKSNNKTGNIPQEKLDKFYQANKGEENISIEKLYGNTKNNNTTNNINSPMQQ